MGAVLDYAEQLLAKMLDKSVTIRRPDSFDAPAGQVLRDSLFCGWLLESQRLGLSVISEGGEAGL
jgi:hypothetical protein